MHTKLHKKYLAALKQFYAFRHTFLDTMDREQSRNE